jgi:hypothetical protein
MEKAGVTWPGSMGEGMGTEYSPINETSGPTPFFSLIYSTPLHFTMSESRVLTGPNGNASIIYKGWGPSDHDDADLKIVSSDNQCLWFSSERLIHHSYVLLPETNV